MAATNTLLTKERDSNLELLRILAMLLIVASHFSFHGGMPLNQASYPLTINLFFAQILSSGGKLGVNIFVLISGYFLATRTVKVTNLIRLWLSTFFYSIIIFAVFVSTGKVNFSVSGLAKAFFPITANQYWFVSCFFTLMLLSPFLSFSIIKLGRKRVELLLLTTGIIWSFIPTLLYFIGYYKSIFYFSSLLWFMFLFILASYIRLYIPENILNISKLTFIICISSSAILLWILGCDVLARHGFQEWSWSSWHSMNSFIIVIISVSLLLLFRQLQIGSRRWINQFAACMFGVYLIHDNKLIRPWLWKKVCHVADHLDRPEFIAWSIVTIIAVFFSCTLIEFLRLRIMDNLTTRILTPLKKWDDKLDLLIKEKSTNHG